LRARFPLGRYELRSGKINFRTEMALQTTARILYEDTHHQE